MSPFSFGNVLSTAARPQPVGSANDDTIHLLEPNGRSSMTALITRLRSRGAVDGKGLGTFIGVFTPSILTILGVIMYLRAGWVVGNVGLVGALAIVVIANLITLATVLSVSSVATNMEVGPG